MNTFVAEAQWMRKLDSLLEQMINVGIELSVHGKKVSSRGNGITYPFGQFCEDDQGNKSFQGNGITHSVAHFCEYDLGC